MTSNLEEINQLKFQIFHLQNQLFQAHENYDSQINVLEEENVALKAQLLDSQNCNQEKDQQIHNLENDLKTYQKDRIGLEEIIDNKLEEITSMARTHSILMEENFSLKKSMDEIIANYEANIGIYLEKIEELEIELGQIKITGASWVSATGAATEASQMQPRMTRARNLGSSDLESFYNLRHRNGLNLQTECQDLTSRFNDSKLDQIFDVDETSRGSTDSGNSEHSIPKIEVFRSSSAACISVGEEVASIFEMSDIDLPVENEENERQELCRECQQRKNMKNFRLFKSMTFSASTPFRRN